MLGGAAWQGSINLLLDLRMAPLPGTGTDGDAAARMEQRVLGALTPPELHALLGLPPLHPCMQQLQSEGGASVTTASAACGTRTPLQWDAGCSAWVAAAQREA